MTQAGCLGLSMYCRMNLGLITDEPQWWICRKYIWTSKVHHCTFLSFKSQVNSSNKWLLVCFCVSVFFPSWWIEDMLAGLTTQTFKREVNTNHFLTHVLYSKINLVSSMRPIRFFLTILRLLLLLTLNICDSISLVLWFFNLTASCRSNPTDMAPGTEMSSRKKQSGASEEENRFVIEKHPKDVTERPTFFQCFCLFLPCDKLCY